MKMDGLLFLVLLFGGMIGVSILVHFYRKEAKVKRLKKSIEERERKKEEPQKEIEPTIFEIIQQSPETLVIKLKSDREGLTIGSIVLSIIFLIFALVFLIGIFVESMIFFILAIISGCVFLITRSHKKFITVNKMQNCVFIKNKYNLFETEEVIPLNSIHRVDIKAETITTKIIDAVGVHSTTIINYFLIFELENQRIKKVYKTVEYNALLILTSLIDRYIDYFLF